MATATNTDKYAQSCIDAITSERRNEVFGDDRAAWFDVFADLWIALKNGAHVRVNSLGKSRVTVGGQYGMDSYEMRPTRILSSGNPGGQKLTYAIMVADHPTEDGDGPYVIVCYSDKTGNELDRIAL